MLAFRYTAAGLGQLRKRRQENRIIKQKREV
jgi:hypothetical protein